jgi:hypothetical protein
MDGIDSEFAQLTRREIRRALRSYFRGVQSVPTTF